MSEHTKEPWRVVELGDCPGIDADGGEQSVVVFGETCEPNDDGGVRGETLEQGKANAYHIVSCVNNCKGINPHAVPAMLEALKAIAEGCSFPEDAVQRAVRDRARAAIAMAETAT